MLQTEGVHRDHSSQYSACEINTSSQSKLHHPLSPSSIESLSKTTKYEDEGVLDNFCRLHIILRLLSWTSLVVAQRVFPCMCRCLWILTLILALTKKKTARHDTISRFCPSAFVRNEVHNEFCQNIRSERRQKNEVEDGIWIHVSLFYPDHAG
jgi:hypothetical protein